MEMRFCLTLFNEKRKTFVLVFLIIYARVNAAGYPMVMVYSLINEAPGCRWFM